jgi:hypothetical protein
MTIACTVSRNWQINDCEIVGITIILMAGRWDVATPPDFDAPPDSAFELDSVLGGGDERHETFAERYPLFWSVFGPDVPAPSDPPADTPDYSDCLGSLLPDDGAAREVFS